MSNGEFEIDGEWTITETDPADAGPFMGVVAGHSRFEVVRKESGRLLLYPKHFIGWAPQKISLLDLDETHSKSGEELRYLGILYAVVLDEGSNKYVREAAQIKLGEHKDHPGDLKFEIELLDDGGAGGNSGRGGRT